MKVTVQLNQRATQVLTQAVNLARRWRRTIAWWILSLIVMVVALSLLAESKPPPEYVVGAMALLLLFVLSFIRGRWRPRRNENSTYKERLTVGWVVTGLGLLLIVLWQTQFRTLVGGDIGGLVGLFLLAIGSGGLMTVWRGACRALSNPQQTSCYQTGGRLLVGALALMLTGAISMILGGPLAISLGGFGAGLVAFVVGLSAMSEAVLGVLRSRPDNRWLLILGGSVALVIAYLLLVFVWEANPRGTVVWLLVLAGIVASITVNSNVDAVGLFLVGAIVFAYSPMGIDPQPDPSDQGTHVIALGDSYMSGEGAPEFYRGTSQPGVNGCRRAPSAYMALAAKNGQLAGPLIFVACSGAKYENLSSVNQFPGEPPGHQGGGLTQLEHVDSLGIDSNTASVVVLSIGGNDASFGEIGRACVLPGDCSEYGQVWLDGLEDPSHRFDSGRRLQEKPPG